MTDEQTIADFARHGAFYREADEFLVYCYENWLFNHSTNEPLIAEFVEFSRIYAQKILNEPRSFKAGMSYADALKISEAGED